MGITDKRLRVVQGTAESAAQVLQVLAVAQLPRKLSNLIALWCLPIGTARECCQLGVQPYDTQRAVAESVSAAGVAVITLPQTNLFLQGRDQRVATPRGLTALRSLLDAGVTLGAGADNVRDPFNLMGRGDPLETAALLVMAGHLSPDEAYAAVSCGARAALGLDPVATVTAGMTADLLSVVGSSLGDAIARADARRIVWKSGKVVARTTFEREFAGRTAKD